MSCVSPQHLTMSLKPGPMLLCLLVAVVTHTEGLNLSMNRTPDINFCAQLKCVADVNEDKDHIQNIIGLRVYKIAQTSKQLKLVSMSVFDPKPNLEHARSNVLNATGEVTVYHGDLLLGFRDESDCLYGSFLCELNFVNVTGLPDVIRELTAPDRENLDSVLLSNMAARMESHSVDVENELSLFKSQTSGMAEKLDHLLWRLDTLEELRNLSYEIPQLERCYKGMPRAIPRVKILLWNNVEALCDTQTDGGGWIIIQRRTLGDVDFFRNWTEYRTAFGNIDTDYWLGNDAIHNLTSIGYNELRIDLKYDQKRYFAQYSDFSVASESMKYQLSVSGYRGTAGDNMAHHNGHVFSTHDEDNDENSGNCAMSYDSGWWYTSNCYYAHLNGLWGKQDDGGVIWHSIAPEISATFTEMKIRQG